MLYLTKEMVSKNPKVVIYSLNHDDADIFQKDYTLQELIGAKEEQTLSIYQMEEHAQMFIDVRETELIITIFRYNDFEKKSILQGIEMSFSINKYKNLNINI